MELTDIRKEIDTLREKMHLASKELDFEQAIELRDKIEELKCKQMGKNYVSKSKVEKTRAKVYERTRKSHH